MLMRTEVTLFPELWLCLDLGHAWEVHSLSTFSHSIKVRTIHMSTTSFSAQM